MSISRGTFLKGAALTGAALTGAGFVLSGCSPEGDRSIGSELFGRPDLSTRLQEAKYATAEDIYDDVWEAFGELTSASEVKYDKPEFRIIGSREFAATVKSYYIAQGFDEDIAFTVDSFTNLPGKLVRNKDGKFEMLLNSDAGIWKEAAYYPETPPEDETNGFTLQNSNYLVNLKGMTAKVAISIFMHEVGNVANQRQTFENSIGINNNFVGELADGLCLFGYGINKSGTKVRSELTGTQYGLTEVIAAGLNKRFGTTDHISYSKYDDLRVIMDAIAKRLGLDEAKILDVVHEGIEQYFSLIEEKITIPEDYKDVKNEFIRAFFALPDYVLSGAFSVDDALEYIDIVFPDYLPSGTKNAKNLNRSNPNVQRFVTTNEVKEGIPEVVVELKVPESALNKILNSANSWFTKARNPRNGWGI